MVVDFSTAFHNVFAQQREWRYNCCRLGAHFFAFTVLMFGSVTPLGIWGRVAAFLGRSLAALFDPSRARTQEFVGDPLLCARGTRPIRTRMFKLQLMWLAVVGLPIAWKKGAEGFDLTWIDADIAWRNLYTMLSVPPEKIKDIQAKLQEALGLRVLPIPSAQSIAGVNNSCAGIVPRIIPFLHCIWASIAAATKRAQIHRDRRAGSKLLRPVIVVKSCAHALRWLLAFFQSTVGPFQRKCFNFPMPTLNTVYIAVDASIWGGCGLCLK